MRRSTLSRLLLALPLLLALAACDSDGDDGDGNGNGNGNGTFGSGSATVEGDVSASISDGIAFFSHIENPDGTEGFVLYIFDELPISPNAGGYKAVGIAGEVDRPGTGTHPIVGSDTEGGLIGTYVEYADQSPRHFVVSESGTLTITSSSETRLVGSFEFDGDTVTFGTGEQGTASVSGAFDATLVDPGDVPDLDPLRPAE